MEKNIEVKMHSFIDVITNSSTSIFITTHEKSVELFKELINKFLKSAGSDKTADDICKIYIKEDEENEDDYKEHPDDTLIVEFFNPKEKKILNFKKTIHLSVVISFGSANASSIFA